MQNFKINISGFEMILIFKQASTQWLLAILMILATTCMTFLYSFEQDYYFNEEHVGETPYNAPYSIKHAESLPKRINKLHNQPKQVKNKTNRRLHIKESPLHECYSYSGQLALKNEAYVHYVFNVAEFGPKGRPLIMWVPGGPGFSGVGEGYMSGIHSYNESSTWGKYPWCEHANVLFFDIFAETGYTRGAEDVKNDDEVADKYMMAIESFFDLWPYLKEVKLYVMGVGYAAIYVPLIGAKLKFSNYGDNLAGLGVGNGCFNENLMAKSNVVFGYYNGLLDEGLYKRFLFECCQDKQHSAQSNCFNKTDLDKELHSCVRVLLEAHNRVFKSKFNPYNLQAKCSGPSPMDIDVLEVAPLTNRLQKIVEPGREEDDHSGDLIRKFDSFLPCMLDQVAVVTKYFNSKEVFEREDSNFKGNWKLVNKREQYEITHQREFEWIVKAYKFYFDKKVRLLFYSGHNDVTCNSIGTKWFIEALGDKHISSGNSWSSPEGPPAETVDIYKHITFVGFKNLGRMYGMDDPKAYSNMAARFVAVKDGFRMGIR